MLWQLWCHCNPDHDKFSFTVVAIFPNVCLWRRSLCSNLENCIEPTSYASTAYVVPIWPSFLFDSFVKIWDTCENILGKWFTAPPGKQFPVRLWEGIGLVCTRRFSFHKFYNFLLFNFLILIFFGIFFLPTTFTHTHNHDPRPTTSTHYPLPTKFSYTRVYIRLCKHGKRFLLLK